MTSKVNPSSKPNCDGAGLDNQLPAPGVHRSGAQRRPRVRRILLDGLVVLVVVTVIILGWIWIQETPLRKAQKYLERGNAEVALGWAEYYLDRHPNEPRGLSIKAQALVGVGRPAEAIEIFDATGVRSANDTYIMARAFMMQEQWSRALPRLLRVLELDPNHPDALYEVTTCRIRLALLEEAIESAERYTKLPGYEARGYLLQAVIYGDQGNYNASIRAYEKSIKLSPNGEDWQLSPDEVYSQYAAMLMKAGRADDAVDVLSRCPPTPAICAALGDAYRQIGDLDNAALTWEKALELEPQNMFAREGLASVALQQNKPEKAIEILMPLKTAMNLKPSQAYLLQMAYTRVDPEEAEIWKNVTMQLRQRGQREAQYERALITAPRSPAAMVIRAHRFATRGNYEQALDIAEELVERLPKDELAQDLVKAIRNRTELPSLERLPIDVPAGSGDRAGATERSETVQQPPEATKTKQ